MVGLPLIDRLGPEGTLRQPGIPPRVALTGSWHYRFAAARIGPDSAACTIAASLGFAGGPGNIAASPRPHDILAGQHAPGVLAAPDGDFDRSRIVTLEPHIRPGCWRDARSDSDRAGRKPDARTARAPVAAAHEPTSAAGPRPSPSTRLTRGV